MLSSSKIALSINDREQAPGFETKRLYDEDNKIIFLKELN